MTVMQHTKSLEPKQLRETIAVSNNLDKVRQLHNWAITVVPLVGFIWATFLLFQGSILQLVDIAVLLMMWFMTGLGITVGFHRMLAHRSFSPTGWTKVILAIMGSMAVQGPPISWVSIHRKHHDHSDEPGDPHSPLLAVGKFKGLQGLWHAHIGWMFQYELPNPVRYAPDLVRDSTIIWINRTYFVWVVLGFLIPIVVELLWTHSWSGLFRGILWGGLVRLFLVQNIIWSINSICHFWGHRGFKTRESSTNSWWLAIPSLGESWHNNHHAFPNSARFGLRWWQVDMGYGLIYCLSKLGFAEQVKSPSPGLIRAKQNS